MIQPVKSFNGVNANVLSKRSYWKGLKNRFNFIIIANPITNVK